MYLLLTTIVYILGLSNSEITRSNIMGLYLIKNSCIEKIQRGFDKSQLWININKKKLINKFDQIIQYKFENNNTIDDDEYIKYVLSFDI